MPHLPIRNSLSQNPVFVTSRALTVNRLHWPASITGSDDDFNTSRAHRLIPRLGRLRPSLTGGASRQPRHAHRRMRRISRDRSRRCKFSFANETSPNVRLSISGLKANTAQASESPVNYVLVIRPDGGEVWPQGQSFTSSGAPKPPARTTSSHAAGNPTPVLNIASNLVIGTTEGNAELGHPDQRLSPNTNYLMRVTKVSPSLTDTSNATFTITAPVQQLLRERQHHRR